VTLDCGKKTRRNYHHISLKGRCLIPLQNPLSAKSNCQYVERNRDLATAEMQMDDCLYVSVPTRANVVSRWVGKTKADEKKLDITVHGSSDMLLDCPSHCTFSHFSEAKRFTQGAALSSVVEDLDRNGGMK